MTAAPVLEVTGIDVRFGGVQALKDVTMAAGAGEVTGVVGPNGAGKTTLFNVICGLQRPNRGTVRLAGADVTRKRPNARARLGLARTFQRLEIFGSMTARENIQVAAEIRRGWAKQRRMAPGQVASDILARVGLTAVADEKADTLPTGMARLVELGRALATQPSVLLLDEPSSGLTEPETAALGALLTELATVEAIAVVLVEHDMDLVMSVCRQIHVFDFGEAIAAGSPSEVQSDPKVQEAYLGTSIPEQAELGPAAGGPGPAA